MSITGAPIFGSFWGKRRFGFTNIKEFFRRIWYGPRYIIQRAKKGYCIPDTWEIDSWFISVMSGMLTYLRDNRSGSPYCFEEGSENMRLIDDETGDECHEIWTGILNRMIFLLGEMDEETCSKNNPYDEEQRKIDKEFAEKYGLLGEKIQGPEEPPGLGETIYLSGDMLEYEEPFERWMEEEHKLSEYRNKCKDEFFRLFSKYFYYLWD